MILETHEVSLRNAPAHCFERISRPQHEEKEWKLSQPDSLTGGDEADSLVKPKCAEFTDQNPGEERVEQREKGPWRSEEEPLRNSAEERTEPIWEKPSEKTIGTCDWCSLSPRNSIYSHEPGWKIPRYQQNEQGSQQGLASKAGNNQP